MKDAGVEIRYHEHFKQYVATDASLSYCSGLGRTPKEALSNLDLARCLWSPPDSARPPRVAE